MPFFSRRVCPLIALVLAALVGLPGAEAGLAAASGRPLASLIARGLPVFCAGGHRHEVALTFDDGPTWLTPRLVATLRRLRATATFFEIGADAERLPAYSRREGRVGAVGDHTQTHATLTREPLADVVWEIAAGRRSVARATGRPVELFRPPGGHRDRRVDSAVARQHLLSVLWTVDPRDWARRTSAAVVKAVESDPRVRGGAIILLHENHATTIAAVARVVKWLRARGLRLVTVPRLLADDPPTLAQQRRDLAAGGCTRRAAVRGAMNAAVSRSR